MDNPRCATDDMIRAVAASGGVIGIFMMSFWLTQAPEPTVDHYVAQIRHIVKTGGIEAAGIANDFAVGGHPGLKTLANDNSAGVESYYDWWGSIRARGVPGYEALPEHVVIPELNNFDRVRLIHSALEANKFTPREIEKIMGGNWHRVLMEVLG